MRMGVHHRLLTWCLIIFKLSLLLIIEIEASSKIEENNLDLTDRVLKIEAKDQHQDGEIVLLKKSLDEERKLVHDLTNRVAILEDSNKNSPRQKRPYRLLPPHIPRGPEENEMDSDESQFRFYGPATGCNDLGRLGYTLNGFYLVQEKESHTTNGINNNNRQIEIVECRFKQNPKSGNQNPDDKEKRLGFVKTKNDGKIPLSRSDAKQDFYSKEVSDEERQSKLTQTHHDSSNIQPSQPSNVKGGFNLKETDDKENGLKFTTPIRKVKSSSTIKPRSDGKKDCLYKLRSEAHQSITPKKLINMCLVAEVRKSEKNRSIITTNEPEYYLGQSPCDSVNEEDYWTIKNKHICSNKNDMCLTVSPNKKDGGVFVNLMAYEASAKSQQWIVKEILLDGKQFVTMTNVGTSLCLSEPMENKGERGKTKTILKVCPTSFTYLDTLFYFEKVNLMNRKNCSPFNAVKSETKSFSEMFKNFIGM